MKSLYDIAIIGGGPGGVSAAVESILVGFKDVILIEKGNNHSQTIRKYYKDNKRVDKDWKGQSVELLGKVEFVDGTKESTIDFFDKLIEIHAIDTLFNTEVEKVVKKNEVFEIHSSNGVICAKYVIVSIGKMGKPNKPTYDLPSSLKHQINFNLDHCNENENILVVGGGNSAVEYAYELASLNHVTLSYRKNEFTRVNPENLVILDKAIANNELQVWLGSNIESVSERNAKVCVAFSDGQTIHYDRIIYAIGGTTPKGFLQSCGIELAEDGEAVFDENFETSVKGLFIAGDIAVRNGGSIAMALNHAYKILTYIHEGEGK